MENNKGVDSVGSATKGPVAVRAPVLAGGAYDPLVSIRSAIRRLRKRKADVRRSANAVPRWKRPIFWQRVTTIILSVLMLALTIFILDAAKNLSEGWFLVSMLCWVVVAQMIIDVAPWRSTLRKAYFTAAYRCIALVIALAMLASQGRYVEVFCHVPVSTPCSDGR